MNSFEQEGFIAYSLYEKIVKLLPIVSVEALIIQDDKLLFLRRNNQPAKGQWWFPGGRIRMGESFEEALFREVKEETGLEIVDFKLVNAYSRVFPERHDITIAYLCKCKEGKITINKEHSEYILSNQIPTGLDPYLIQTINDFKKIRF